MKGKLIILNSRERKHIRKQLEEQFGINNIPDSVYFCINTKEEVYIANRELFDLDHETFRSSAMGLHFGTFTDDGFALSVEGVQLVGEQATKNFLEISVEERDAWLKGEDLDREEEGTYIILKNGNDFLGCAHNKKGKLVNTLPRTRTMKNIVGEE